VCWQSHSQDASHDKQKKTTSSLQINPPSAPFAFPWGSPQFSVSGNRNRPQPSVAAAPGRHRHVVNMFGNYRTMEVSCRLRVLPRLNYRFTVSAAPC
jgi:hypothetical protein